MKEATRQFLVGFGSIFFAPFGAIPQPGLRITLPPNSASEAIAHDFARVSADLEDAIERVEQAEQMELGV
jgi:hypothetical protein